MAHLRHPPGADATGVSVDLVEVFSSVQGEGPYVGSTTVFVRLGRCDLRCRWCDSPGTWLTAPTCRLEIERGRGRFETRENPLPVADVIGAGAAIGAAEHAFVAITGGEPLLQPEAVRQLARAFRPLGPKVFLETHGLAVDALAYVVEDVDVVSMDWKLASDVRRASDSKRAPVEPFHGEHERFLEVARRAPDVVVKWVVTPQTTDEEIDEACRRVIRVHPGAAVIVQPVTPFGGVKEAPTVERLLALVERVARSLPQVRLIPQTHKLYGAP